MCFYMLIKMDSIEIIDLIYISMQDTDVSLQHT